MLMLKQDYSAKYLRLGPVANQISEAVRIARGAEIQPMVQINGVVRVWAFTRLRRVDADVDVGMGGNVQGSCEEVDGEGGYL